MYIVTVELRAKPDKVEEFLKISIDNATNSRREPDCLRFDVLKHESDPQRFFFYEVYKTPDGLKAHQQTAHYARWRDAVGDLLATPRVGTRYFNASPADGEWQ